MKKAVITLLYTGFLYVNSYAQTSITSINPDKGSPGAEVVITGSDFSITAEKNIVYFGATKAIVTAAGTNSLTVKVPAGATYMPISVLNTETNLIGYSNKAFMPTYINAEPGTFNFNQPFNRKTDESPRNMAIGDIDGDRKPDVAVVNTVGKTVSLFRNISAHGSLSETSFSQRVDLAVDESYGIVMTDIDGDGKLDLAVTNADKYKIIVFRNISTPGSITKASFAPKLEFPTAGYAIKLASGDIDGDGKPDLVTTNMSHDNISILRNTSVGDSISFAKNVDLFTGEGPEGVTIADIDGDKKPEILVCNELSGKLSIFHNKSEKGTITYNSFDKSDIAMNRPVSIAVGDLDGDGKPEITIGSTGAYNLSVFLNKSSPGTITANSFSAPVEFKTTERAVSIAISDIDGDNKPDLVVANALAYTPLNIFRNTSTKGSITTGSFAPKIEFSAEVALDDIVVADMDADSKPDIMVVASNANVFSVFRNKAISTGLKESASSIFFHIYPNPAVNSCVVKTEETGILYLFSMEGKEMARYIISDKTTLLNLPAELTSGIYISKFTGQRGLSFMSKLAVK
ncbi:MAG: FG-GAP-like repeat-containing protein [Bacteroidia bacterium]